MRRQVVFKSYNIIIMAVFCNQLMEVGRERGVLGMGVLFLCVSGLQGYSVCIDDSFSKMGRTNASTHPLPDTFLKFFCKNVQEILRQRYFEKSIDFFVFL
jgi:hypothetical protein